MTCTGPRRPAQGPGCLRPQRQEGAGRPSRNASGARRDTAAGLLRSRPLPPPGSRQAARAPPHKVAAGGAESCAAPRGGRAPRGCHSRLGPLLPPTRAARSPPQPRSWPAAGQGRCSGPGRVWQEWGSGLACPSRDVERCGANEAAVQLLLPKESINDSIVVSLVSLQQNCRLALPRRVFKSQALHNYCTNTGEQRTDKPARGMASLGHGPSEAHINFALLRPPAPPGKQPQRPEVVWLLDTVGPAPPRAQAGSLPHPPRHRFPVSDSSHISCYTLSACRSHRKLLFCCCCVSCGKI